jgi:hypothetical protein
MSTQTIEIRATRRISSKWWIALAVATALVVALVLMAGAAGDRGGAANTAPDTAGNTRPAQTLVVTGGPASGHPLP